MWKKTGGRKFIAFMAVLIVGTVLVVMSLIEAKVYASIIMADIWAYMAGNVGKYGTDAYSNRTPINRRISDNTGGE